MAHKLPAWVREHVAGLAQALPVARIAIDTDAHPEADGVLELETDSGARHAFLIAFRSERLGPSAIVEWLEQTEPREGREWVLIAPAIGAHVATKLRQRRRSFLDAAGSVFLTAMGSSLHIDMRARATPPPDAPSGVRALGVAGLRVLFALLANPANLGVSARAIALRAHCGRHTVAQTLAALRSAGLLERRGRVHHAWRAGCEARAASGFVEAWARVLRPRLQIESLVSPLGADEVEAKIAATLTEAEVSFAFGGSVGARELMALDRGPTTVVHLSGAAWQPAWNAALRAAPAERTAASPTEQTTEKAASGGSATIHVFETLGAEDLVPGQRHAHPLLLRAELARSASANERDQARRIAALATTDSA